MEEGDQAFFYHSVTGKEIVGIAEISEAGLTDPKDPDGKWAAVRIKPVRALERPVTLAEIKADPALAEIELVRQSRLSVARYARPNGTEFVRWQRLSAGTRTPSTAVDPARRRTARRQPGERRWAN